MSRFLSNFLIKFFQTPPPAGFSTPLRAFSPGFNSKSAFSPPKIAARAPIFFRQTIKIPEQNICPPPFAAS